jgi:hypothetical protein
MHKNDYDYRYHRILRQRGPTLMMNSVHKWLPIVIGLIFLLILLILSEVKFGTVETYSYRDCRPVYDIPDRIRCYRSGIGD